MFVLTRYDYTTELAGNVQNLHSPAISGSVCSAFIFKLNIEVNTMEHPYEIERNYLIRTVTMIQAGKLAEVFSQELVLTNAAWIADTGRFSTALEKCEFSEVEMFPAGSRVIVNRSAIIDAVQIDKLPTETK